MLLWTVCWTLSVKIDTHIQDTVAFLEWHIHTVVVNCRSYRLFMRSYIWDRGWTIKLMISATAWNINHRFVVLLMSATVCLSLS